jgi:hypothetical protein
MPEYAPGHIAEGEGKAPHVGDMESRLASGARLPRDHGLRPTPRQVDAMAGTPSSVGNAQATKNLEP